MILSCHQSPYQETIDNGRNQYTDNHGCHHIVPSDSLKPQKKIHRFPERYITPSAEIISRAVENIDPRNQEESGGNWKTYYQIKHDGPRQGDEKIIDYDIYLIICQAGDFGRLIQKICCQPKNYFHKIKIEGNAVKKIGGRGFKAPPGLFFRFCGKTNRTFWLMLLFLVQE